jgi:uncharacterized protein
MGVIVDPTPPARCAPAPATARRHRVRLAEKVAFLSRPDSYPGRPSPVLTRETHMSWVFLAGDEAYKLKKPVRFAFLDYTTIGRRRWACGEEVRLNRRLAPTAYLGLARLTAEGDRLRLGGPGRVVDWLVWMRRLPEERMLDRAIAEGRAGPRALAGAARLLARFYRDAEPVAADPPVYLARLAADVRGDAEELSRPRHGLPAARIEAVAAGLLDALEGASATLGHRIRDGRFVEGHGDLRPEHVLLGPRPMVIDCLEFRRDLRLIDPADELGFLALECDRLGAPEAGGVFLRAYEAATGDRPPHEVILLYQGRRALLRAKLAAWHEADPSSQEGARWRRRALRYLDLAAERASRLGSERRSAGIMSSARARPRDSGAGTAPMRSAGTTPRSRPPSTIG